VLVAAVAAIAPNSAAQNGEALINGSDCLGCHALDTQVAGPSWKAIAKRYRGQNGVTAKLSARIRAGGSGSWGNAVMSPHSDLTDAQARQMVSWILSRPDSAPAPAARSGSKTYTYTPNGGKPVQLDFPLFAAGKPANVTKDVFRGYELFNSYCYRCHGTDATGSQLGPDLRHSLSAGMKQKDFIAIAMAGRKDKGMPSWAGFLSSQEMTQVYQYTKGRSLDLVPAGRPPGGTE
jgi:cytochrome c